MRDNTNNTALPTAEWFRRGQRGHLAVNKASPHLHAPGTVRGIMGGVLVALLPAVAGSVFFFGFRVLPLYLSSILGALLVDIVFQLIRHRSITGFDLSAVLTGTLLAMSLPANAPLWFPALGSAFGVLVAKELFGGIGHNFLNPAILGRTLLRLVFPDITLQNPLPTSPFGLGGNTDVVASATPLMSVKEGFSPSNGALLDELLGTVGGKLGETSALLLLLGVVWMLAFHIIKLRIPLSMLGAIAIMAYTFGGPDGLFSADWRIVCTHLLGGASILGAFYMATDYSSSPAAPLAQYLYGAALGVVTMLFRLYSQWSEGFTFAALILSFTVPLLNRYVRPRVLGEKRSPTAEKLPQ